MEEYLSRSHAFQKRLAQNAPGPYKQSRYLFFRMMGPLMQARLARFLDLNKVPKVFVHGNPHLDNYVKTHRGSALVDFDRSRIGPYAWDIIRFLSSLSLKREEDKGFLDTKVVESFLDGYITHFLHPDIPYKQIGLLKKITPERWQISGREYLRGNKKWAKKLHSFPVSTKQENVKELFKRFLVSRGETSLMNEYYIDEVGMTPGTLGKIHYVYSLIPKNPDSAGDYLLFDIKEVYSERDTANFYNPYPHHGIRMIEASKLFADGMEERLGYASMNGKQYWGRQIPTFAAKVKKLLDEDEQMDVAYSIGSQLGKGHRKFLKDPKHVANVEADLMKNFDTYFKVSKLFTYEIRLAYDFVVKKHQLYRDFKTW